MTAAMSTEMGDWTRASHKGASVECISQGPTQPSKTSATSTPMDILTETLPFIDDPDDGSLHSPQVSVTSGQKSCVPGDGIAQRPSVQKETPTTVEGGEETLPPHPALRKQGTRGEETSHLQVWGEGAHGEEWHDVSLEDDHCGPKGSKDGGLPDRGTSSATFPAEPTADQATTLTQKTLRLLASPRQLLLDSMMRPHSRHQSRLRHKSAANVYARPGAFLAFSPSDPQGWLRPSKSKATSKARQADSSVVVGAAAEGKLPYRTLSTPATAESKDLPLHHAFPPTASERSFTKSTRMSWVLGVNRKHRRHRSGYHQGNSAVHGLETAAEGSRMDNGETEGGVRERKASNPQKEHVQELPASEEEGKGRGTEPRFYQSAGPATAVMVATARHLAGQSRKVHQRLRKGLLSVLMCGAEDSVYEKPPAVQQLIEQLQYHPHAKSFQ